MAQFNYEQYAAQQAARRGSSNNQNAGSSERVTVHFFGEYIKNDGDVMVVRFPYRSMSDISFETTHVVDYPGSRYKKRVSCSGDGCPFCAGGVKIDTRCFVKGLVYVADDDGKMNRYNAVWDRPSAFADIEIQNLLKEYGDLTKVLIKIRRTGSGLNTRYTTSIVLPNNAIYNDTTCVADFSELDKINASRILCKTVAQYNAALNPPAEAATETPAVTDNPSHEPPANSAAPNYAAATMPGPAPQQPSQPYAEPVPATITPAADNNGRTTRRYVF